MMTRFRIAIALIILLAIVYRSFFLSIERTALNSDEAVVGLMARHIVAGEALPTFYYGQAYMGSLDAFLVAGGFLLLGASIETLRLVQLLLYGLNLLVGAGLAYTVSGSQKVSLITLLLMAFPVPLAVLYTTITLGGYNELILLGNLALLLGWQISIQGKMQAWRWAALGLTLGLGWWVNNAIVTPALVVGLAILARFAVRHWPFYGLAGLGFLVGSAPWWLYNLKHDWAALRFLFQGTSSTQGEALSPFTKGIVFLFIEVPSLLGLRLPWKAEYQMTLLAFLALCIYALLVMYWWLGLRREIRQRPFVFLSRWQGWLWLGFGFLFLISVIGNFVDPSGRYLLPLWGPLMLGFASLIARRPWQVASLLLSGLLIFYSYSTWIAAQEFTGLEAQMDEALHLPVEDDAALYQWMVENNYQYGYASYWLSYRMMFRFDEQLIFDTSLPYDRQGYRSHNNRYPPYVTAVAQADRVLWITQNFPELDSLIESRLRQAGVHYEVQDFGRLRAYYDFSGRVDPASFNLNSTQPLVPINLGQEE